MVAGWNSLVLFVRGFFGASGLSLACLGLASGCFNPNGGATGYFAYKSTPLTPKTISIYDVRTGEAFFVQEVPVGKQLNFRFLAEGGDDPLYSPGRLQWVLTEAGNNASQLVNQLTCPPEESCRIEVSVRAPEYPSVDETPYRVDASGTTQPFTPEGGRLKTVSDRIYE